MFSSAPPGMHGPSGDDEDEHSRGGAMHKACRTPAAWRRLIEQSTAFEFDEARTQEARRRGGWYLRSVVMVFHRPDY